MAEFHRSPQKSFRQFLSTSIFTTTTTNHHHNNNTTTFINIYQEKYSYITTMSTTTLQGGNLTKLAKEEQWHLWLEDLLDVIALNKLQKYYYGTAQMPTGLGTEQAQTEWNEKHDFLRHIIHSALSTDIREKMRHHGYDRDKHRGKDIVDLAEKSVKLISGNMDMLYDNMWKDLRRTDYASWAEFTSEFRRLYAKLRESGLEVTRKAACIHLFQRVKMHLPVWAEINESKYLLDPDVDKLLLELESKGRQLEYDGVTLANLKSNGDRKPKESISESRTTGAAKQNYRIEDKVAQKSGSAQGQSQGQRPESRDQNHHGDKENRKENTFRKRRYCETCAKTHYGKCWPICRDCDVRHHPNNKCYDKPKSNPSELQGDAPDRGNSTVAESSSKATENIYRYGLNAMFVAAANGPLTKGSWIFDTGASYHVCNDLRIMKEVVQGEIRTTTAATGQTQSGNLFGKVRIVVKCETDKRIITLNDVMYIPESPCNLVSDGKFRRKGLYLDGQKDVIHNGIEVIANCPSLLSADVRILEIDSDNETIVRNSEYSLLASKAITSSFDIWHQ